MCANFMYVHEIAYMRISAGKWTKNTFQWRYVYIFQIYDGVYVENISTQKQSKAKPGASKQQQAIPIESSPSYIVIH